MTDLLKVVNGAGLSPLAVRGCSALPGDHAKAQRQGQALFGLAGKPGMATRIVAT